MTKRPLISVIDDDESIRESIAGLANWLGLGVEAFDSAIAFLSAAEPSGSACIIADVQMPGMTGIELYSHLKALGHTVPTILITAYPDDTARARALAEGVVCYLSKPLESAVLIGCIRSAMRLQP